MNTIAWLFILSGLLVARQVSKGRVSNITQDLGDAFIAVVSGDTKGLTEVLKRTGESNTPTAAETAIANLTAGFTGGITTAGSAIGTGVVSSLIPAKIMTAAITRGTKAKGYVFGATGPDYYDCSGLIWRAFQDGAGYKGPRFTTTSFQSIKEVKRISAPSGKVYDSGSAAIAGSANEARTGDYVVWNGGDGGGHMGVITGPNKFYSARSSDTGIGESPIQGFHSGTPMYFRYVG